MRPPRNEVARVAPMNLKMHKCLIINNRILRFMGRISAEDRYQCVTCLASCRRNRPAKRPPEKTCFSILSSNKQA